MCIAETGQFESVPEYMCSKMDAYAATAARWYEQQKAQEMEHEAE